MSNPTKAVSLTEDEIWSLLQYHGRQIGNSAPPYDDYVDRINYLNKRLKAFKEPDHNDEKVTATSVPKPEGSTW